MTTATLLKIGDIAKRTGVSVATLRYYESLNLLYPVERGENNYRYYSSDTIQQVQFIKKAQTLGFSLEDIRRILEVRDHGELPCDLVQVLLQDKINQLETQIQQMIAFKSELENYRDRWSTVLPTQVESDTNEAEVCPLIATVPFAA